MKYSIIIPTFQRPNKLIRSVQSVLSQSHQNFEIICVNDSPDFNYIEFDSFWINLDTKHKDKIKYLLNTTNNGVNFSRNHALEKVSYDSDYVIFLDDDDWFNENALSEIDIYINQNKHVSWLVTNRVIGEFKLTNNQKNKSKVSYFFDYLIFKNCKGDATHVIQTKIAKNIRFSQRVKNGEEWFYFVQIPKPIYYKDLNTTLSEGYDEKGLNQGMQQIYKTNTKLLWGEITGVKMFVYMVLRGIRGIMSK